MFCSLFEVQPIPLKELGAIATRKIKKGELVIEESPLFVLCVSVKFLQAAAIEDLHLPYLTATLLWPHSSSLDRSMSTRPSKRRRRVTLRSIGPSGAF